MKNISNTCIGSLIFGYAFLYVPIVLLIVYSFNDSGSFAVWTYPSLKWFRAVFENEEIITATRISLKIACLSATGSVIIGSLIAAASSKNNKYWGESFLSKTMKISVTVPDVVLGFALLIFFVSLEEAFGIPRGRGVLTVTIGHIMASVAYVHITIKSRMSSSDKCIKEAAMNLGAKPLEIFIFITVPTISRSILAGWLLAFSLSIDDIVMSSFLSGPGATTLPVLIFSNMRIGCSPEWNAFAAMFVFIGAVCLLISFFLTRKRKKIVVNNNNRFFSSFKL